MTPVGLLNAEKIARAVLLYVFRIAFTAPLLCSEMLRYGRELFVVVPIVLFLVRQLVIIS